MSLKIDKNYFSGNRHVYEAGPDGLAAILRGLAIDNARAVVTSLSLATITDNSGGTASSVLNVANIVAPHGQFDASAGGGVQSAAFNTSLGKIRNAEATWVAIVNKVAAKLGLPLLSVEEGTSGAGTVGALDLTATTATGAAAADYSSFVSTASLMVANMHSLFLGVNAVLKALGNTPIPGTFLNSYVTPQTINISGGSLALIDLPATVAAVLSGTAYPSVSLADGTAFLAAMANNFATLASYWQAAMVLTGPAVLTDSTGGTPAAGLVAVLAAPLVAHQDNATDSAGATAVNAILAVYQNAFSSLQAKLNSVYSFEGMAARNDNSGGTASSTLSAESIAPAAAAGDVAATAIVTESTTKNFINGDVLVIGNQSFTFVTTLGTTPGTIQVRADTNAGFRLSMGDVLAAMANVGGATVAGVYVPNVGAAADSTGVASDALTTGAVYTFTSKLIGTAGNASPFTYTAAGTAGVTVNGSGTFTSGADSAAASLTSINAAMAAIEDNTTTIAKQLDTLLHAQGLPALADASGGVDLGAAGLMAIPALAVANNGYAALGATNVAVIAALTAIRNNIATLNATLATIIGEMDFVMPINVVAG